MTPVYLYIYLYIFIYIYIKIYIYIPSIRQRNMGVVGLDLKTVPLILLQSFDVETHRCIYEFQAHMGPNVHTCKYIQSWESKGNPPMPPPPPRNKALLRDY